VTFTNTAFFRQPTTMHFAPSDRSGTGISLNPKHIQSFLLQKQKNPRGVDDAEKRNETMKYSPNTRNSRRTHMSHSHSIQSTSNPPSFNESQMPRMKVSSPSPNSRFSPFQHLLRHLTLLHMRTCSLSTIRDDPGHPGSSRDIPGDPSTSTEKSQVIPGNPWFATSRDPRIYYRGILGETPEHQRMLPALCPPAITRQHPSLPRHPRNPPGTSAGIHSDYILRELRAMHEGSVCADALPVSPPVTRVTENQRFISPRNLPVVCRSNIAATPVAVFTAVFFIRFVGSCCESHCNYATHRAFFAPRTPADRRGRKPQRLKDIGIGNRNHHREQDHVNCDDRQGSPYQIDP